MTLDPAAHAQRLWGLPPVVSPRTAVLVLGSFPGVASLRALQYYGHPQNHFWRILQALWPHHPLPAGPESYALRCQWLLDRRLGVWDVYASCVRQGSLDTAIRDAMVNDFALLRAQCPYLTAIAHNGTESYKHAPAVLRSLAGDGADAAAAAIESIKLPSTSPANASWSFERKLAAWADLMARHGLL
ncbi:DNA-deoxyinosine glycosylase [Acidovorax sp.]|uniref:DNA-deoxyinosine glycosylase n=1 Tax=Acidovorax sp. TaxID=1872122 RepID=UPI003918889E